jgi:hypothetical protein
MPIGSTERRNPAMTPTSRSFKLPATATFAVGKDGDKCVAHALDFDIVCVAETEERAIENLRLAVKTYVEYGLSNGWTEDIMFPAPEGYWSNLDSSGVVKMLAPIEVDDRRMVVFRAAAVVSNENRRVACSA